MRKISILLQFILVLSVSMGYGQTILFSEDFESGEIPLNWKEEFVKGSISWQYENGGYTLDPEIPYSRKPIAAHGGEYNALFQFQSSQNEATKLVTKRIDAIEFAIKPELHFYHAQFDWKHGNDYYHDYLRVYYKTSASSSWKLLAAYTGATTDWVERIILLPENDLSADYYLAFEGQTKWGWGTCVDDITILETGARPKTLSNISVEQASDVAVSSGTSGNPILRINLKVLGNSGTLPLNSLVLKSLNTSDSDLESGGVKLYFTRETEFNADNPVGSGVSFSSGQASFTNLNYDLPIGYSYLWVTYDVKLAAGHRNLLDAYLARNSINIRGNTYPSTDQSPAGSRMVLQSIHADNFESGLNWTLLGEFEYGSPQGLGGAQGNPDPVSAYSGSNIIGTDITGIGDYEGDYEKNILADEYSAISDTLDFTYYNDLSIRYMRYLNIGVNDVATVDISPDGGKTWKEAWTNSSMILDDKWKLHEIDITEQAARKSKVRVRYSLGTTNDYWQLSGWNIDNFSITGSYVSRDVGISEVIEPREGCGHTASDSVSVYVKNFGAEDSYGTIPLQYSFDGNATIVHDTLHQIIPFGDSVLFTFKKKVNLSVPGIYDLRIQTGMNGDNDQSNDGISDQFYVQPTISNDHTETFESRGGLWITHSGTSSNWEWGAPGYGIVPPSGSKLWMTRLLAHYPDQDSSFIESVCYSNESHARKILQLSYWSDTEPDKDGTAIQFTTDNGLTWQLLDTLITGWDWYTGSVQSLNSSGWSGNSQGWISGRQILPERITNASSMKFRLAFASDQANNDIGFAVDDFSISTAPPDIGISGIDSFATRCQNVNPDQVTVAIRNYGINPVAKNDTIIVGFDFNQAHVTTDTFTLEADLLPGGITWHTFANVVDVSEPGYYNITAYTLIEDDPYFYVANNDTISFDFEVLANPLTLLPDTIPTREPDTVMIPSFYDPDYDYLWSDMSTGNVVDVEKAGWYTVRVTATRGNGCISRDSSYVLLLFNDIGIDSLVYPYNHCGLGNTEYVQLQVRNFGTDSLPGGEKIAVAFTLNGGIAVTDTLVLAEALYSGQSTIFTFSRGAIDLSPKGIYQFTAYSSFSGDTIQTNDTLHKTVEIYGLPNVDLGPDVSVKLVSYTLDAGSGFTSYTWDDGTTTQTREVTEPGNYWVHVVDENLCDNADTAYVWLKIRDIRPDTFTSPVSDCRFTTSEPVSLQILNSGTDTIPAGQHIELSYRVNDGASFNESFDLSSPLLPGEYTIHTFAGNMDLMDTADYRFEAVVIIAEDMRISNDTADLIIYRYPMPVVDFGLNDIENIMGIEFSINAGYSPYYSYQWQDNFNEHLYLVTHSGEYWVKATDTRTSCYDGDSVTVFLIFNNIGVTATSLPEEGCTGDFSQVVVSVTNLGTSNIGKDVPIYVACDINSERIALDTLVRSSNFLTGSTLDLVLSTPLPIHGSGTIEVALYTLYTSDMKSSDDSLVMNFDALPSPVVDFGDINGVLEVDLPHVLDAGTGNKSYLWQNGSTNQTFTVTANGTYSVTVTGQNDCQSSRTVEVNPATWTGDPLGNSGTVVLYPNPNHGLFYISINSETPEELTIQVMNSQGQTVYIRKGYGLSLRQEPVDVQHLPRGMYHIVITGNGKEFYNKMIIQ